MLKNVKIQPPSHRYICLVLVFWIFIKSQSLDFFFKKKKKKEKIGPLSAFSALSPSQASRGAEIFSFLTADWNLLLKESFKTIIFATVSNWLHHHCILKKNLPSTITIHLILLITMINITTTNIIILLLISGCTGSLLVVASHRICNAAFPPQLLLSS